MGSLGPQASWEPEEVKEEWGWEENHLEAITAPFSA